MPTFPSFEAFGREVSALERDLMTEAVRRGTWEMAEEAQKIARDVASEDLGGDPKFSGWAPELDTRIKRARDSAVLMPTRRSAGPWTVAERGRNQGDVGSFFGPGVNRRTGRTSRTKSGNVRKVRTSRAKRWNGYTYGKNTATEAVDRMDRLLPKIMEREARRVTKRHFDVT